MGHILKRRRQRLEDVPFEQASNVADIRYRFHPLDVGFDLRRLGMFVELPKGRRGGTVRVSYPAEDGSRRVMNGPRELVVERLEALGFRFVEDK